MSVYDPELIEVMDTQGLTQCGEHKGELSPASCPLKSVSMDGLKEQLLRPGDP